MVELRRPTDELPKPVKKAGYALENISNGAMDALLVVVNVVRDVEGNLWTESHADIQKCTGFKYRPIDAASVFDNHAEAVNASLEGTSNLWNPFI